MGRVTGDDASRKIESLTANLLECYEELDLMHRLSGELMSTLDAGMSAALVLREAVETFEADLACLVPARSDDPPFAPLHHNADPASISSLCGTFVEAVMAEGKSRIVYSVERELGLTGPGLPASLLCAVLKTETETFGALCIGRRAGAHDFTAGELKLANTMATQAAIAIENSRLHEARLREQQKIIRLSEEMRLAREIQTRLLPRTIPRIVGYDIAGRSVPAQSVGGDYFDLIPMDDGRLAVCLGDVSGKGLPAALIMSNLQAAIRGQTLMRATPMDTLQRSNTLLFQSTAVEKFASCFYGILDPREHRLCYANAGHDHPLLYAGNGEPFPLDRGGLVLGIVENADFEEVSVAVEPGSLLLIYSDGIIDAVDGNDGEFGTERLRELVVAHRDDPAETLVEAVIREVEEHAKGTAQTDDMTLVVIRRV